ncbi:MAG: DeoR/GlpR transcriptional regulator [Pirellulales bacterium]|nr:DeoR/GlpR transcriptional regulator [Pirellulales bacterium]
MSAEFRRTQLIELVRRQGFAPLPDLAKALDVSESTIRRDLAHLEREGATQRTHGGAFYTGPSPNLPHFEQRQSAQWDKKRAIARTAAELIEDNDTVLLDGGSTTYELARLLVGRPLQVVTNSLPVANLFSSTAGADLIVIGGYVHGRSGTVQGPHAEAMIRSLHVRRAIISAAGVNERGLFNSNLQTAAAEQAMLAAAEEVMAVIDSTKFGHQSLAFVCELPAIHRIVVDDELSPAWRRRLADARVETTIAPAIRDVAAALSGPKIRPGKRHP